MSYLDAFMKEWYAVPALKKMGRDDREAHPNFRIYEVGWLETGGPSSTWDTLEVIGAEFRVMKSGPRKGQLGAIVPGTICKAYIQTSEKK
ncbi:hypothetical protein CPT_Maja_091 [Burkholderia phage Maja]|uniref:Uncharacterized protein n=1 Tax=Burkholderia phage Maja TaxID=2767571 RepID=A0A7S6R7A9_9CAUD|nr:hypothetical protein CPT_Maja_091 [Burkholderia phage Maja]